MHTPPEAVIAEKFEAMVTLGMANSRMKDFFDVYMLTRTFPFDGARLRQALQATFTRRQTPIPVGIPLALTMEFGRDPSKDTQWNAFIRKSRLMHQAPAFVEVIDTLGKFLWPVAVAARDEVDFTHAWDIEARTWGASGR